MAKLQFSTSTTYQPFIHHMEWNFGIPRLSLKRKNFGIPSITPRTPGSDRSVIL